MDFFCRGWEDKLVHDSLKMLHFSIIDIKVEGTSPGLSTSVLYVLTIAANFMLACIFSICDMIGITL